VIDVLPFSVGAATLITLGLATACLRPRWIIASRKTVLGAIALITLGAASALIQLEPLGLTIDVDPASEPLINPLDPGVPIYRQAVRDFGNDDVYVIVMQTGGTFDRENLEALHRLTHQLRGLSGVASVQSLARVLSVRHDPGRDLVSVDHFMDRVPEDLEEIDRLERRALANPLYRKTLISDDGLATAINLNFRPMTDAEFVELDLDGKIASLLEQESEEGRRFYIAGRPHVRAQAYHMMVGDLVRLIPVGVVAAALTLWFMTGSTFGVLIPLASCLISTLWVFGAMATLGMNVNLITLVLGSMMICIGSVYGVHVYARFEIHAADSRDGEQAALECLRYARTPVMMAGVTTCIGFAALLLANIPATNGEPSGQNCIQSLVRPAARKTIGWVRVPDSRAVWSRAQLLGRRHTRSRLRNRAHRDRHRRDHILQERFEGAHGLRTGQPLDHRRSSDLCHASRPRRGNLSRTRKSTHGPGPAVAARAAARCEPGTEFRRLRASRQSGNEWRR
jgi:hypothetical protein